MSELNRLKEFRAEEIVKIFLLRQKIKLKVEKFPTPMFDFFVTLSKNENIRFAIEVKSKNRFQSRVNNQINKLKIYRNSGMINIPVLLIKVDDKIEKGEFDFLVFPSFIENKLLIRYEYKFKQLTNENFETSLKTIEKWYKKSST